MAEDLTRADAAQLARALTSLLRRSEDLVSPDGGSAMLRRVAEHLGRAYDQATLVSTSWPLWQHVSAHRAVSAYVAEHSPGSEWLGVRGRHREHEDLMSVLGFEEHMGGGQTVAADYVTAACGPDRTEDVVSFGLQLTRTPAGRPAVLALRLREMDGPLEVAVEVLTAERADASALVTEVRRLVEEHDVLRGQVLAFGESEHYGNSHVTFLPRPELDPSDVILPPHLLAEIEEHVAAPARRAQRLRAAGIHLKRGLLLHGPPGTGKTHTVRYLMGRMRASTVVVLTGQSLHLVAHAAALARRLQPTVVVVEDVDLIAEDRSFSPTGNPMLFTLLDTMDGIASDADVTFILTTNRVADLERALVQRPGRVDRAIHIPLPDADARLALLRLYAGRCRVTADLAPAVEATEGATASATKELMRRAVLAALEAAPDADPPDVDDTALSTALAAFTDEHEALTRSLLGSSTDQGPFGHDDDDDDDDDEGDEGGEDGPGPRPALAPWFAYPRSGRRPSYGSWLELE